MSKRFIVATANVLDGTPLDIVGEFDHYSEVIPFVQGWQGRESLLVNDTLDPGDTRGTVGPYAPSGQYFTRTYVGDDPTLKGKTALVGYAWFGGMPVAQFDDFETGYAGGWHKFKPYEFDLTG